MRFSITSKSSPPGSGSVPSTESVSSNTGPGRSRLRAGVVFRHKRALPVARIRRDPGRFSRRRAGSSEKTLASQASFVTRFGCAQRCVLHGINPGILLRTIHTARSLHKYTDWINGACTVCAQARIPPVSPPPATPWIHPQRAQPLLLIPLDLSRSSSKSSPVGKLPVDNRIPTGFRGSSCALRPDRLAFNFTRNALRCCSIAGTNADAWCLRLTAGSGRQAWWGYSEGTLWTWRRQRV